MTRNTTTLSKRSAGLPVRSAVFGFISSPWHWLANARVARALSFVYEPVGTVD